MLVSSSKFKVSCFMAVELLVSSSMFNVQSSMFIVSLPSVPSVSSVSSVLSKKDYNP